MRVWPQSIEDVLIHRSEGRALDCALPPVGALRQTHAVSDGTEHLAVVHRPGSGMAQLMDQNIKDPGRFSQHGTDEQFPMGVP